MEVSTAQQTWQSRAVKGDTCCHCGDPPDGSLVLLKGTHVAMVRQSTRRQSRTVKGDICCHGAEIRQMTV